MPAVGIEYRAVPGIEARRILQRPRRGLDRVERAAAAGEHGVAGFERHVEVGMDRAFVVGAELVALDDAGAAMDDQGDGTGMRLFFHRERISDRGLEPRSEEHTSELQSLMRISYAGFCLKKKKRNTTQ